MDVLLAALAGGVSGFVVSFVVLELRATAKRSGSAWWDEPVWHHPVLWTREFVLGYPGKKR